jgi:hypothetical protein
VNYESKSWLVICPLRPWSAGSLGLCSFFCQGHGLSAFVHSNLPPAVKFLSSPSGASGEVIMLASSFWSKGGKGAAVGPEAPHE